LTEDNSNTDGIEILIAKYVSGNASQEEVSLLEAWKGESENNLQIYHESLRAWNNSKNLLSIEQVDQDKTKILFEINKRLESKVVKLSQSSAIIKIVAAVSVPLVFAISWYFLRYKHEAPLEVQVCSIMAPKGHISKCLLPDGTEVWVNTGSAITYNTSTYNKNSREVNIDGEAYFQVKKDTKRPFRVLTPVADLMVTGTSFNIKAYQGSGTFETVLDEGSILLQMKSKSNQEIQLVPGERAVFDLTGKEIKISKVETAMYSSWRKGEIIFRDATLNDLVTELERIYEISFHFKNENLRKYRFRGMLSYNNNLIDALEKIKKTSGIRYYIENKEVWLSK